MNFKTSLYLAAAGLAVAVPVFGQSGHGYVRAGAGPVFTENTAVTEYFGPVSGVSLEFDPGVHFEAAAGYHLRDWAAVELESGINYNTISSVTGGNPGDSSLSNIPLLANLVLEYPNDTQFVPFIGGGVGASFSVLDVDAPGLHGNDTDAVFAYQGFGGVRYNIGDRMGISLAYHYYASDEPSWDVHSSSGTGQLGLGSVYSHAVSLTFTVKF